MGIIQDQNLSISESRSAIENGTVCCYCNSLTRLILTEVAYRIIALLPNQYVGLNPIVAGLSTDLPCKLARWTEIGNPTICRQSLELCNQQSNQRLSHACRKFNRNILCRVVLLVISTKNIGLMSPKVLNALVPSLQFVEKYFGIVGS